MKALVALSLALSLAILLAGGCREKPVETPTVDAGKHQTEIAEWQENRATRLKAEDGWLSLIGLFWLNEGNNVISLPSAGSPTLKLARRGAEVTLEPDATMKIGGQLMTGPAVLLNDADEAGPTVVERGSVRFQVIKRGERYGLRVKDAQAHTRTHFEGLDYYPTESKLRVEAKFEPYDPPKKIPITDVTGMTSDSISPGALVFTIDGKEYRLDPVLEEGTEDYFVIFKDATSKDETYQAGRYLYTPKPGPDGKTVIDFNKAYNPPCAFTGYATCPLPPLQNRLPIRVEAGEKRYAGGHS
ncbi:MAG TPA: DUF1684 domain-containing protein [Thermoanaerobaculia bacterium]|nr:DUF1684 domain-containing protein [Thermoanaerobaculia bacterium]